MKLAFSLAVTLALTLSLQAQTPTALVPGIQVDSLMRTHANPNRMALDPVSRHLYYCLPGGDVYELDWQAGWDSLRYTVADHGIQHPQGMCFVGNRLFLSGHTVVSPGIVHARISKGTLQPGGGRTWTTVVLTADHPASKHPFTTVIADPAGNNLYWASGARTMAGEVWTDNVQHPGRREGPLNTRLFKIPIATQNLVLPNDSAALDSGGYTYCSGLRNAYSIAFNQSGHLIAIDNSGERDDPEELNWLQQGRHYGFPWRMGGNWNPLMDPNYDVQQDPLVNPACAGYAEGIFAADPGFPAVPTGLVLTDPIRNLGPDADFYRDSITGQVHDASVDGAVLRSFTAHRSPLGLTIDRQNLLGGDFRGQTFALSYMPGGDSSGMSPVSPWGTPGPFVDPAQDLLQLNLAWDSGLSEYTIATERIVEGFYLPVDAVLDSTRMYVLEQRGGGRHNLWRVTFTGQVGATASSLPAPPSLSAWPNPTSKQVNLRCMAEKPLYTEISVLDLDGRIIGQPMQWQLLPGLNTTTVALEHLPAGAYLIRVGHAVLRIVRLP